MKTDPFAKFVGSAQQASWTVTGLDPSPEEEWRRMLAFLALTQAERQAMLSTVEVLFRRGYELVVDTYEALLQNPDTAAILGWERGADPAHLSERRRFFTVWLAHVVALDMSDDLARYLFHAGKIHAAHGPRVIHVPPLYVTASISLVNAGFARFLREEMPDEPRVPLALAGWNKLLSAHLHLMQIGYYAAVAVDSGDFTVNVALFGKMRHITGAQAVSLHLTNGARMHHAVRKLFNYFPTARSEVFDVEWQSDERIDHTGTPWFTPAKVFRVKPMWRVLLNGKDVTYLDGAETALCAGDEIHIFPPGR